jgi:hypothetical protein
MSRSEAVAGERLLTYRAAAQRMGITPKAFRDRVHRGTIPDRLLFDRERDGKRKECFVLADEFTKWCRAPLEPETKEIA